MKGFFTSVFSIRVLLVLVIGCGFVERGVGQSEPEWIIHRDGYDKLYYPGTCMYGNVENPTQINDTSFYCSSGYLVKQTRKTSVNKGTRCALETSDGKLFIASHNQIDVKDNGKWKTYDFYNTFGSTPNFTSLLETNDGTIYAGSIYGLFRFKNLTWSRDSTSPWASVSDIIETSSGELCITTDEGLYIANGNSWDLYNKNNSDLTTNSLYTVVESDNGDLYIASRHGLFVFDGVNWVVHNSENNIGFNQSTITALAIEPNGDIIFGLGNHGIGTFSDNTWTFYNSTNSIEQLKNVTAMHCDEQNNVFIGTRQGLIIRDEFGDFSFSGISNVDERSPYDDITGFAKSSGNDVYVIAFDGVSKFTNGQRSICVGPKEELFRFEFNDIAESNDGSFYFATDFGVIKKHNDAWSLICTANSDIPTDKIESLKFHQNGDLYLGSLDQGLIIYNGSSWTTFNRDNSLITTNSIYNIQFDSFGNAYINNSSSLNKFNGEQWSIFNLHDYGITSSSIIDYRFSADTIFIATSKKGILKIYGENSEILNTSTSPLLSDSISSMIQSENYEFVFLFSSGQVKTKKENNWTQVDMSQFDIIPEYLFKSNEHIFFTDTQDKCLRISKTDTTLIDLEKSYFIPSNFSNPRSLFETSDGTIYIPGGSGFTEYLKFKTKKNSFSIHGKIYIDSNTNGLFDSTEDLAVNQRIEITNPNRYTFSDSFGEFEFKVDSGQYTINFIVAPNQTITSNPKSYSVVISENHGDTLLFGINSSSNTTDLSILMNTDITRCDFEIGSQLNYVNKGITLEQVIIQLELDDEIFFENSSPEIDSISIVNNKLYWSHENLLPSQFVRINLSLQMPGVEHIGDTLRSYATISTLDGSYSYTDTLESILTCAYDPNDKLVKPLGKEEDHLTLFGDDLTYTVRFQNTGNDTAFTVVVKDTIDLNLDMNTFEVLASSHEVYTLFDLEGNVSFTFNDILLPDSNVNEMESHGFVSFKISPKKGLDEYTEINNTAYIFFDFNPPIVTNETWNTMVSSLSVSAIEEDIRIINSSSAAPNPFSDVTTIHFENPSSTNHTLELFDVTGKVIKTIDDVSGSDIELNRNKLRTGLYFYCITEEGSGEVFTGKLVVE